MEVEGADTQENLEPFFKTLVENLALNPKVVCKSQQKDEVDLTASEKVTLLTQILNQNKPKFLFRFGQFLNNEELKLFEQFQYNPETGYEIAYHLRRIHQANSTKCIKNRRFSAVKRLSKDEYFSEKEMRKRNPLLYDQLIGLYLSSGEVKLRDLQERDETTLVSVLMQGIDKEDTENKRLMQEEAEDAAMKEEDSSDSENEAGPSKPNVPDDFNNQNPRQFWGEITDETQPSKKIKKPLTNAQLSITAQERNLLKEEFYNSMYESFLEGKDDYDYSSIDNNEEYDNLEIIDHDEEEKYFDSEDADNTLSKEIKTSSENETSEDELDIYMNSLNQNPAVSNLAEAIKKL